MGAVLLFCRSEPARDRGLAANPFLPDVLKPCGSWLASDGGLTAGQSLSDVLNPIVGVSLLAIAVLQPTHLCRMYSNPVGAGLPAMAA
ncbi:hypothetical protein EMIT0P395_60289 [Pseudomonas sp. IT-P395]